MFVRFHISSQVRSLVTGSLACCAGRAGLCEAVPIISISWTPWKGMIRVSMPTTALAPDRAGLVRRSAARARWRVALKMSLNSLISPRPRLFRLPSSPPPMPME